MTARSYTFEAPDTTGVLLGLSVSECCITGAGLAATVGLRLAGVPVTVSVLPVLVAGGAAKVRVAGRPLHQWLGLLAGWCVSIARGGRRWRASLPLLPASDRGSVGLPPMLRGLDIVELGEAGRIVAVVRDRRRARLTAVLPVRGTRFTGEDAAAQDALLSGWGDALAAHAGGTDGVVQVGWSHQATPTTLAGHLEWVEELPAGDTDERQPSIGDGYDALVSDVTARSAAHETVVWLTVAGADVPGKGRLLDRAAARIPVAIGALADALRASGLDVGEPLTAAGLWRLLRRRSDPSEAYGGQAVSLAARMGLGGGASGGPLAIDTAWSEVRIDGTWHRVYWVEAWPRRPVTADWLGPFFAASTSSTATVLYRPIAPERSRRRVDGRLVKLGAYRARKEDKARRVTELDERTEQAARDLEAELASGYAEMLYLGLVCVSAPSRDDLEAECQAVEHAARAAQLGLRVLHGRQDAAWAAALPFGVAMPNLSEEMGL